MIGVMKSKFPAKQGKLAINQVSQTAFFGSASPSAAKRRKIGIMLSLAIELRSCGAPVKLCNPAPMELIRTPMFTRIGSGQQTVATTSLFVLSMSRDIEDPKMNATKRYKDVVVMIAASVPIGIDLPGRANMDDLLHPAMIPVTEG